MAAHQTQHGNKTENVVREKAEETWKWSFLACAANMFRCVSASFKGCTMLSVFFHARKAFALPNEIRILCTREIQLWTSELSRKTHGIPIKNKNAKAFRKRSKTELKSF